MFENKGYNINIPYGDSAVIKFTLRDGESGEPFLIPSGSFLKLSVRLPKSAETLFLKTAEAGEQSADGSVMFVFSSDETKTQRHGYCYTLALVIPDEDVCDTLVGFPEEAGFAIDGSCTPGIGQQPCGGIAVSVDAERYRLPDYEGSYLIEPSYDGDITLSTRRRSLSENITVKKAEPPDNVFTFSAGGLFRYPANVYIPNTVTSLGRNTERGFYGHTEIETVTFEEGSTVTELPMSVFQGCSNLRRIELPNTITTVVSFAFHECSSLEELVFPASVTRIYGATNRYCTSLKRIVFNSVPQIFSDIDRNCTDNIFHYNTAVEDVVFPAGWTYNTFISDDTAYCPNGLTHDCMTAMIASLYDYSGGTAHTLTLGATNLARLSADEIAAANAKNWTLL